MHDHQVDTWAVGVLLYELLTSKLSFRGVNDEDVGWSEESKIIIWPKEGVLSANFHARHLITNLLKEKPSDRISLGDVLEHPFMKYLARNVGCRRVVFVPNWRHSVSCRRHVTDIFQSCRRHKKMSCQLECLNDTTFDDMSGNSRHVGLLFEFKHKNSTVG